MCIFGVEFFNLGSVLYGVQVKSGFACEEDVKTIKCQISGRVQQLKREREGRRWSTPAVLVSQSLMTAVVNQMPLLTSNLAASTNGPHSQEKDGCVDGLFIFNAFITLFI